MIKKAIIIGNGQKPSKLVISRLQNNGFTDIVCADGGANNLFKLNIIPKFIIGDLDSIRPDVLDYYSSKTKVIKVKDQNSTDIEKCLNKLIKLNYSEAVLLSCTGNRLDHSLGNLSIMYKYAESIKTHLVHQKSFLSIFNNKISLDTTPGEIISFFGINPIIKISTTGLKYNLNNETITFGFRESISNKAMLDKVTLEVTDKIFLIRDIEYILKNDFLK
ncbi:MAG: thiamine diphosphokinase [bacterium]